MAKPAKRKIEGGRLTPQGRVSRNPLSAPIRSGRYTPPTVRRDLMPSPRWVPILMFTLLGLGVVVILLNYVDLLLPGATDNAYLLVGLVLILAGIVTATRYR